MIYCICITGIFITESYQINNYAIINSSVVIRKNNKGYCLPKYSTCNQLQSELHLNSVAFYLGVNIFKLNRS